MTNERQKPAVPTSNPASTSNPSPAPQQNQSDTRPSNEKPGQQQHK
jgi:hypothetical protein